MKIKNIVPLGIIIFGVCLSSYVLLNPIIVVKGFVPWGIVADDESVIQPFITSRTTGKDFRIPQDEESLDVDSFWVYLEWRGSVTNREFIIQLLEEKEREIIVGGISTTEEYWEVYDETVVSMIKGSNVWNDPRFALIKIDSNTVPSFQKSDVKERIRILYRNLEIEFDHRTSYAEVEQTKTIQEWNTEAILLALWILFLCFLSGIASRWILDKATWVPDLPHWSLWILITLVIAITTVLFFLVAGYNLDEVLRVIVLIPAPVVGIVFAVYFAFWLASKFRPKKLLEILFIILDLPSLDQVKKGERHLKDEKELPIDAVVMDGYINKDGEIELVNDIDSYWETIRRIKMGGIHFNMAKLGRRIRIKQKLKNFDDIIFCEKFEKNDIEVKVKAGALYSISSVITLIGVLTWILPLLLQIASIITSILGTVFLVAGILFFFWENVDITSPIVSVNPITDRDAITIIRDKLSLDMKNEEIAELEMDLYEEKTSISKRARLQTLKAIGLMEDAVLPIAELAREEELDLEGVPDQIKKVFKKWVEDWKIDSSTVDIKDVGKSIQGDKD